MLSGKVEVDIDGFEVSPGVWVAEGADVHPDAMLHGPLYIGDYAKVEAGAELREYTVLGSNVVVKAGAFLHRAVVHDNVFIGPQTNLRACVIGKNTDIMRAARIDEGAVVGDECVVGEEAIVSAGVKIYPFKTVEAGAVVNTNVIFESRGQRALFGPRGVSGIVNVEITPELAVRLAGAWATTLKKGATVTTSRDVSRAARALKRAVISALTSSAINVVDLEVVPVPVARLETAQGRAGRSRDPHHPRPAGERRHRLPRQPRRRPVPGGAAQARAGLRPRRVPPGLPRRDRRPVLPPARHGDLRPRAAPPGRHLRCRGGQSQGRRRHRRRHGRAGAARPCSAGSASTRSRSTTASTSGPRPRRLPSARRRCTGSVASSRRPAPPSGCTSTRWASASPSSTSAATSSTTSARCSSSWTSSPPSASKGRVALPVTTTRLAEQVAAFHGVDIRWIATSPADLTPGHHRPGRDLRR